MCLILLSALVRLRKAFVCVFEGHIDRGERIAREANTCINVAHAKGRGGSSSAMASIFPKAETLCYRNLLVVIKQTAYEEYSQVREKKQKWRAFFSGCLDRTVLLDTTVYSHTYSLSFLLS